MKRLFFLTLFKAVTRIIVEKARWLFMDYGPRSNNTDPRVCGVNMSNCLFLL